MFSIRYLYVLLAETFLTMLHITWQGGKCVKADGPATMTFYQYSAQKKEICFAGSWSFMSLSTRYFYDLKCIEVKMEIHLHGRYLCAVWIWIYLDLFGVILQEHSHCIFSSVSMTLTAFGRTWIWPALVEYCPLDWHHHSTDFECRDLLGRSEYSIMSKPVVAHWRQFIIEGSILWSLCKEAFTDCKDICCSSHLGWTWKFSVAELDGVQSQREMGQWARIQRQALILRGFTFTMRWSIARASNWTRMERSSSKRLANWHIIIFPPTRHGFVMI